MGPYCKVLPFFHHITHGNNFSSITQIFSSLTRADEHKLVFLTAAIHPGVCNYSERLRCWNLEEIQSSGIITWWFNNLWLRTQTCDVLFPSDLDEEIRNLSDLLQLIHTSERSCGCLQFQTTCCYAIKHLIVKTCHGENLVCSHQQNKYSKLLVI